ncbi:hypothetical protein BKA70DRAFT_1403857 [Coprinopsis sp. MPI-PUGE-AT-0042]|nr:hypothetical protein BKA70DRAFT_1403857 [Coprinopsis sp. MPI-PUGE-AT-0042]
MVGGGEFDEVERALQEGSERGDAEGNVLDDEDEEGGGLNPLLADAILKRSSSIRMNSKRSTSNLAGPFIPQESRGRAGHQDCGVPADSVVGLLRGVSMPGMANGGGAAAFPSREALSRRGGGRVYVSLAFRAWKCGEGEEGSDACSSRRREELEFDAEVGVCHVVVGGWRREREDDERRGTPYT